MRWAQRPLTPTPAPPPCCKLTLGARNWEDLFTTHFGKEPGKKGGVAGSGTPSIPQVPKNQDPHSTLSGHMWLERGNRVQSILLSALAEVKNSDFSILGPSSTPKNERFQENTSKMFPPDIAPCSMSGSGCIPRCSC